ncbi:MAG: hypothetical protein KGQ86_02395 [Bacteroidetes bacterium]|nr:hypothetical protein [Bacteroidota bacterium]
MNPTRLNVWSSPRNVSTAFMYSFGERPDVQAFDEPLYAHYLLRTKSVANHPARELIIERQLNDGKDVVDQVILGKAEKNILFFKQMTHHLVEMDWSFMTKTRNILLIRNPREIIASYSKVIPNPTIDDIGVALQQKLFLFLKDSNALTAVVDARDLLSNPGAMLEKICALCQIPYLPDMLHWPSGPKSYDGIWAPHWYSEVHQSTGFKPFVEKQTILPDHLEPLAEACAPYYATLIENTLKIS